MRATFELDIDELDVEFFNRLKELFGQRHIRLTVIADTIDETDYLLSSEANKQHLLQSMKEINEGRVISFDSEKFFESYNAE